MTINEDKIFDFCKDYLQRYEEGFSDLTCLDVANDLDLDINFTKGVIGSLCKKNLLKIEFVKVNSLQHQFIHLV